jgi:hypothetical protein
MEGIDGVGGSSSGSGRGGLPSLSIRTSSATSLVFAVGDGSDAVARTMPTGWVAWDQWKDRGSRSTSWGQYTNQPIGRAGTVVKVTTKAPIGGHWNMAAVELTGDGN